LTLGIAILRLAEEGKIVRIIPKYAYFEILQE